MDKQDHWENVYAAKDLKGVSWFRKHLEPSPELIESADLESDATSHYTSRSILHHLSPADLALKYNVIEFKHTHRV